jgi:hypothetical protein
LALASVLEEAMSPPQPARGARSRTCAICALLAGAADARAADPPATVAAAELERVTVTAGRPTTMPVEIPTTIESVTGAQVEKSINATDARTRSSTCRA